MQVIERRSAHGSGASRSPPYQPDAYGCLHARHPAAPIGLLAVAGCPPQILPQVIARENHGVDAPRPERLKPFLRRFEKGGADSLVTTASPDSQPEKVVS